MFRQFGSNLSPFRAWIPLSSIHGTLSRCVIRKISPFSWVKVNAIQFRACHLHEHCERFRSPDSRIGTPASKAGARFRLVYTAFAAGHMSLTHKGLSAQAGEIANMLGFRLIFFKTIRLPNPVICFDHDRYRSKLGLRETAETIVHRLVRRGPAKLSLRSRKCLRQWQRRCAIDPWQRPSR